MRGQHGVLRQRHRRRHRERPGTLALVSNASHGALTLHPDGAFTYVPATTFAGTDTFSYQLTDPDSLTAASRRPPSPSPPGAGGRQRHLHRQQRHASCPSECATGVLANDADADTPKAQLQVAVVTTPTHGSLSLLPTGAFSYTPAKTFSGTDTFTYRVSDPPGGTSNTATATITVSPVSCGPRSTVTVTSSISGGALVSTLTATDSAGMAQNRLLSVAFGPLDNAPSR